MSSGTSPWHPNGSTPPGSSRLRLLAWLAVIVVGGLLLWELSQLFPGQVASDDNEPWLIRNIALLVLLSGGIVTARQIRVSELLRGIILWSAIAALLALAYSYKSEISDAYLHIRSEAVPGYPTEANSSVMVLTQNSDGSYYAIADVNGVAVRFLVDTGASDIVLSPQDAQRLGIDLKTLSFTHAYETANGEGRGATVVLSTFTLGSFKLFNISASVNRAKMRSSLLGMSFLRQMKSFEFRDGKLYLQWR